MKFAVGEKVLCYHGSMLYEAKVLKSETNRNKELIYFIHYAGWNKNWDEWVFDDRVLQYNAANLQLQKEARAVHTTGSAKKMKCAAATIASTAVSMDTTKKSKSANASASSTSRSRKSFASSKPKPSRKKQSRTEVVTDETFSTKEENLLNIPDDLKNWLIDDSDAVKRQKKLLQLPAKKTVQDIIDDYVLQMEPIETANQREGAAMNEVSNRLGEYFDVMLGGQLLYEFEEPQHTELLEKYPNTPMSKLYGSFHLLRLFVKLNSVLPTITFDERCFELLLAQFQDFLTYMSKNSSTLFNMQQFFHATAEYHRRF